jgi:transposase
MDANGLKLPDDIQTLHALVREHESVLARREAQLNEQQATIDQLQRVNAGLSHRLDLALRRLYGRSSEKIDPGQLLLFGQAMQQAAEALQAAQERSSPKPARQGHGRKPLPADLPRHRVEHPIDPAELTCPCCDQPRVRIGQEISEQLDYTPASLFVIQHVRPKYACRHCDDGGVATAEKPAEGQVIDKGLPGPGLVAHVITGKYADHQPLYRQEQMLARHGVDIRRSTMCGWMKAAGDLLRPLVDLMGQRIRQSKVIHTDDTPVPVHSPGNRSPGRQSPANRQGKTKTGRLWVYLGDPRHPYTVFDYTPDRTRAGPAAWLKGYEGYLQADAFTGYDGIYLDSGGRIVEVACWAHTRRKFYDARHSDSPRSHQALAMIRLLYDVERDAKELDATERRQLRQKRSCPLLNELHTWLRRELPDCVCQAGVVEKVRSSGCC